MKTRLIIIIILLCSTMWSFGQVLRPPVETNDLRTLDKFSWQGLEMQRDSLSYWYPINPNSFTLYRPDASFSQTYSFPNDSVFWPEYNIWVCSGCQIYYNDSIFYVRRDPECGNCWQYSYNRVSWRELFCESNLDRTIDIVTSSRHILKDGNYIEWIGEDSLDVGVTYLGFKRRAEYEGKTLRYKNDSVQWLPSPDSLLYMDNWIHLGDTLSNVSFTDSLYDRIAEKWIFSGDTISIRQDSSVIDSSLWELNVLAGGINPKNDLRVGIGQDAANSMLSVLGSGYIGISSRSNYRAIYAYSDNQEGILAISASQLDNLSSIAVHGINWNDGGDNPYGYGVIGEGGNAAGVYGKSSYGHGVQGRSVFNYSGYFTGGLGFFVDTLKATQLTVGPGTTITRTGSIAEKDIWTGTQAEYDLLTPVVTTLYFIHNGYGIFGIIFLMLLSFGSKAQNWAAVKIGETDVNRIYQGEDIIWEKPSTPTGVFTMTTTSTSSNWSPQRVTNSGAILHWSVTGAVSYEVDANKPTFNFSTPGTKYITVTNADNFIGVTDIRCYSNQLTSLDVSGLSNLFALYCYDNQLTSLDVSGLSNLSDLYCYDNQLTSLDVSGSSNFDYLICYNNKLTSLDISGLSFLAYLLCSNNQLTTISINFILDQLIAINNSLGSYFSAGSQIGGGCGDPAKIAALDAIWETVYVDACY